MIMNRILNKENLGDISEIPECQLIYLINKYGFGHGFISELHNRFNKSWQTLSNEYIQDMIAEYHLLYKNKDE